MEISYENIAQLYNTVSKMMCFMRDVEQSTYNNSQICEELYKRVEALEAEHESAVDAFEDGFAAGEKRALSKIEAAEYNAYESGYRAASGGKPSPEHKAAISKPIKKAEPEPLRVEVGDVVIVDLATGKLRKKEPAAKAEKSLTDHIIDKLSSLQSSTMGITDPNRIKIQLTIQAAIDELKAEEQPALERLAYLNQETMPAPEVEPINVIGVNAKSGENFVNLQLTDFNAVKKVWSLIERYNAGEIA